MTVSLIIATVLGYLFLVFQYKALANLGAKDLTEVLSEKLSTGLLNRRTIQTSPLLFLTIVLYSIWNQNNLLQIRWTGIPVLMMVLLPGLCSLISIFNGNHNSNIVKARATKREVATYFSIRVPGLIVYEIFFRGVLLGLLCELFSKPAAVALNIMLYAMAHAFGSRKEFIGSLPFGLLLCFVTLLTQSIYPAVLFHLCLALPYESILFIKSRTN